MFWVGLGGCDLVIYMSGTWVGLRVLGGTWVGVAWSYGWDLVFWVGLGWV